MDPILIGIALILLGIICFVYTRLSKKLYDEINKLNEKIDKLSTPQQTVNTDLNTPVLKQTNTNIEQPNNYNNIKEQYDNYVQNNNFDNIYEDELTENIKNEIDEFANNEFNKPIIFNKSLEAQEELLVEHDSQEPEELLVEHDAQEPEEPDGLLVEQEELLVEQEDQEGLLVEEYHQDIELSDDSKYNNFTLEDINKLTLKELQEIARKNKLKIKGKKDELLERVKTLYNLNINLN